MNIFICICVYVFIYIYTCVRVYILRAYLINANKDTLILTSSIKNLDS